MAVNIRQVEKNDNPILAEMIKKVFREFKADKAGTIYTDPSINYLYELFQLKNAILYVAEEDGKILGCCGVYPTEGLPERCGELVKFYVSAKARGTGLGKALMRKSEKSAYKMGYTQLYIESLPEFSNAVYIYQKNGYQLLNKRMGHSGHFNCNIWLIKDLTSH